MNVSHCTDGCNSLVKHAMHACVLLDASLSFILYHISQSVNALVGIPLKN